MSRHSAAAAKRPPRKSGLHQAARREEQSPTDAASTEAQRLATELNRSLAAGRIGVLTPEAMQSLMAATCRLYAAQAEAGATHLPLGARSGVTATDVMVVSSGLLKAVNLAVFELGMWQSWTGR